MKVVFDTNFLISMVNFHVSIDEVLNIFNENVEPVLLKASITELEKLIKDGKYSERKSAKLALSIVKAKKLKVIGPEKGYVDDLLLELNPKEDVIATQDSGLKRALKKKGFRLVVIRQKKYAKVE